MRVGSDQKRLIAQMKRAVCRIFIVLFIMIVSDHFLFPSSVNPTLVNPTFFIFAKCFFFFTCFFPFFPLERVLLIVVVVVVVVVVTVLPTFFSYRLYMGGSRGH